MPKGVKAWGGNPSDIQGIYNFMVTHPNINRVRVPWGYFAWGDARAIRGRSYEGEIVLVRHSYRSIHASNYWGFRFKASEHPEIKPTVFAG